MPPQAGSRSTGTVRTRTAPATGDGRARGGAAERRPVLLALAALAVLGLAAVYAVAVGTRWGRDIDDRILAAGADSPAPGQEHFGDALDLISTASLAAAGIAIALVALARRRLSLAVGAVVIVLGANVTTQVLKVVLPRPEVAGPGLGPSFPSGHTTVAMSLLLAALVVLPPGLRAAAGVIGLVGVNAIGIGVVAALWHRPSDVVGAYLVCLAWAALVTAVLAPGGAEVARRAPAPRLALTLGLIALAGVVLAVAVVPRLADPAALADRLGDVEVARWFWATGALLAATAVLVVVALVRAMRDLDLAR